MSWQGEPGRAGPSRDRELTGFKEERLFCSVWSVLEERNDIGSLLIAGCLIKKASLNSPKPFISLCLDVVKLRSNKTQMLSVSSPCSGNERTIKTLNNERFRCSVRSLSCSSDDVTRWKFPGDVFRTAGEHRDPTKWEVPPQRSEMDEAAAAEFLCLNYSRTDRSVSRFFFQWCISQLSLLLWQYYSSSWIIVRKKVVFY